MLTQKGFSLIGPLVILFAIALSAGGGYYLGQKKLPDTKPAPIQLEEKKAGITSEVDQINLALPPQNQTEDPLQELKTVEGSPDIVRAVLEDVFKDSLQEAKTGKNVPTVPFEINVTHNDGKYASGGFGSMQGGGGIAWFAAKIDGSWKIVHKGQDQPLCADISKYNIPKDILTCAE